MKLTIDEFNALRTILSEENTRIGKYNRLIHNKYKNNVRSLLRKVDTKIRESNSATKTQQKGIKKYTFSV